MDEEAVSDRAAELPDSPGVYQFLDRDVVLYVGKAVSLRDRVRSYANPGNQRAKRMVATATELDYAVTDTETQALLLEANLIKRHHPRYNVRLKDDKSYPVIQLTDHEFPRIEVTRDPDDAADVFGPFTDKGRVDETVKALRSVFGVRACSDHKYGGRKRPCLDYEIGLCSAPCTAEVDGETYASAVEDVERFLSGESGILTGHLREQMERAAEDRAFERAATIRDRLAAARTFHEGRAAAIQDPDDVAHVDVLGVAVRGEEAIVARFHSEGGKLLDRERHRLSMPDREAGDGHGPVLSAFISQYYADRSLPDTILVPEDPADADLVAWLDREGVSLRVPAAGRESTLVELAIKNANRSDDPTDEIGALGAALDIPRPTRIEGFDVSHAQGREAVGSNVVFVDGDPDRSGYRRRKLEDQNDDVANMRRLIDWRADRAVSDRDDRPDPDLLVIDGGAGQLNAALDCLTVHDWSIPTVGLAKPADAVITPDGTESWDAGSPALHVLQRVRDEAHRFAVQYHQTLRDDIETILDDIPGVGPDRRRRLLRRFGSVDGVRAASETELRDVDGIGERTARAIQARL